MSNRPATVLEALRQATARDRTLVSATVVLAAAATLLGLLATGVILLGDGRWIVLPPILPAAILVTAAALAAAVLLLGWRYARRESGTRCMAEAVELERQLRNGSLVGLLELDETPVAAMAAARLAASVPAHDPAPARSRRSRRRLLGGIALLLLAAAGFTWSGTQYREAATALRHPMQAASGALLEPLRIDGAPPTVRRGTSVAITVRARGRRSVMLHSRIAGAAWKAQTHRVVNGTAEVELGEVSAATQLFASDARGRTDTLTILPADGPFVQDLALHATYPRYLGRPDERLAPDGELVVPSGTQLRLTGTASEALSDVVLYDDSRSIPFEVAGARFSGSTTADRSTVLRWRIATRGGEEVEPPRALHIAVSVDEPPQVEIVTPASDTGVVGDSPVRVTVRATDDHQLGVVALTVRRGGSEEVVPLPVPPAGGSAAVFLDISSLAAGEGVTVRAIAAEAAGGGRRSLSAPRIISVLTAAAQRDAARLSADSAVAAAAAMASAQRQVERTTTEVSRARGDRRDQSAGDGAAAAGHALASRARSIVEEQRALSSRADSLAAATRALESRLSRAGALDDGLAARLAEVRSLLQRALTPELAARLRDAESAARDDAEEPLRRALSDVALEQRRAREQLERVVQMLRRAAIEGSLETLRAEAAELAQQAVGGGGEGAPEPTSSDRLRDAGLATRAGQLGRDIAGVVRRLEEERASAGLAPARAAGRFATAAGDALAGAAASRASAAAPLGQSAEALAEARAAQIAEWKRELAADLDAAVQELMQLATAETELARRVAGGSSDWRDEHSALEEASTVVADRIARAARTSTLVSSRSDGLVRSARDGVVRVSAATFPPRDRTQVSALMRDAAASLSRAAASLLRDRERTNSARSASGFAELLEELQRLAAQQRGLNAASAGLPLALSGGSQAARDQARVLARQQRAIARALEELGDADGGGRAQPLAAEANRVADALERAAVDASLLSRQDRLYNRLLQGGRLLTGDSGEDEDRREAVTAQRVEFPSQRETGIARPGERRHLAPGWAELKTLTPAERQMIIEYFERLNGAR
ncbi:MAG TPA: hypothetical protein VFZ56_01925 [Gemmatimonadaceae bacterium]